VLHPANSRERDKAIKGRILATLDLKKDAIKQYILNNTLNNIL